MSEPSHRYDDLFRSIGEVTVTWTFLEVSLELWLDLLWSAWGGDRLGLERPRTSMGRKLDFIKSWYKSDARFEVLFPDLIEMTVNKIDILSDHRHLIIHGMSQDIARFPESGTTTLELRKFKRGKWFTATNEYSIADLQALRNNIVRLATTVGAVRECFVIGPREAGDDAFSKLLAEFR